MAGLRKPTAMYRATVDRNARVIVEPEAGVPADAVRHVRLLVPQSPAVSIGLDQTPDEIGANREYKLPVMPAGQVVFFNITAGQFLTAMAGTELAELAVIVEYRTASEG